ncbi:MAG: flavodoxin family protein [Oscillospiraceae bacterium]|nr:flavodoxin family protein [Oscillospiraceae bacterium]
MKILVLNGSPHPDGATSDMVNAFARGAESKGHEVRILHVARKNIRGCMDCGHCRNREKGVCAQKDDMQEIYPEILSADMVVFASPIYYFTLSAQLQAAIQRTYAIDIPANVSKVALILSSGSPYVYGPAISAYYQSIVEYWGVENAGIFTANGRQNKSEAKRQELYRFGSSL